jgi:malate/lactate dehydrogenase
MERNMKIGIIGAGAVGSACLLSLVLRGSAREVVLVDRERKRVEGVVADVQYGALQNRTDSTVAPKPSQKHSSKSK